MVKPHCNNWDSRLCENCWKIHEVSQTRWKLDPGNNRTEARGLKFNTWLSEFFSKPSKRNVYAYMYVKTKIGQAEN